MQPTESSSEEEEADVTDSSASDSESEEESERVPSPPLCRIRSSCLLRKFSNSLATQPLCQDAKSRRVDFASVLPVELSLAIFRYFDEYDWTDLQSVCRNWATIINVLRNKQQRRLRRRPSRESSASSRQADKASKKKPKKSRIDPKTFHLARGMSTGALSLSSGKNKHHASNCHSGGKLIDSLQDKKHSGGGGGSSGSDDDDRRRELITELERMGFLEVRNKGSRLESVRWTKAAHRDLRPPLQRGLVCYTDAELYANLMRYHPELCDDTGLDRDGGLLERCGEGTKSIDEIHSKTVNYRRAFSFGGATTPAAAPSIGGGLFGPTVPSTSLFGASTSTGTSSLFGGAGTGASTTSTSPFGAPAASTGTTGFFGGSSFGSTPSTPSATSSGFPSLGGFGAGTTSTFGAPATSTGSSLFGRATTGGAGSGVFPGFSSTTPGASSSLGMDGVTK